jgi:hypothetical protein
MPGGTMSSEAHIPTFAVVGHPNEGKSSVVATLTEDDSVRISDFPGETTICSDYSVRVDDRVLIRFLDTPGFQHPKETLDWMQQYIDQGQHPAKAFVEAFRQDTSKRHDVELMTPLAAGAGIIYVVDGSRPLRKSDLCEMEILRMTGNPRLALINPKDGEDTFLQDWKDACAKTFNLTRTFNAHHASFGERMALLESLKRMHQDWEPAMVQAVGAFEADWKGRNREAARVMTECLAKALELQTEGKASEQKQEDAIRKRLVEDYQQSIIKFEENAQSKIRVLYRHRQFRPRLPEQSILREDLFTERSWQLLGLSRRQIIMAAAILGGGAGVKLDLLFANLSFGLFTLSGATLAAVGAWLKGENMARVSVKRMKIGGVHLTVGPNRNPQFPFVLMDRLLLYYQIIINWAHARQDHIQNVARVEDETKMGFTAQWDRKQRDTYAQFFKKLRSNKETDRESALAEMQDAIEKVLWSISHDKIA